MNHTEQTFAVFSPGRDIGDYIFRILISYIIITFTACPVKQQQGMSILTALPAVDVLVVSPSLTHEREARGSGDKPIRSLFLRNVAVLQHCVKLRNTRA